MFIHEGGFVKPSIDAILSLKYFFTNSSAGWFWPLFLNPIVIFFAPVRCAFCEIACKKAVSTPRPIIRQLISNDFMCQFSPAVFAKAKITIP